MLLCGDVSNSRKAAFLLHNGQSVCKLCKITGVREINGPIFICYLSSPQAYNMTNDGSILGSQSAAPATRLAISDNG